MVLRTGKMRSSLIQQDMAEPVQMSYQPQLHSTTPVCLRSRLTQGKRKLRSSLMHNRPPEKKLVKILPRTSSSSRFPRTNLTVPNKKLIWWINLASLWPLKSHQHKLSILSQTSPCLITSRRPRRTGSPTLEISLGLHRLRSSRKPPILAISAQVLRWSHRLTLRSLASRWCLKMYPHQQKVNMIKMNCS